MPMYNLDKIPNMIIKKHKTENNKKLEKKTKKFTTPLYATNKPYDCFKLWTQLRE